MQQKGTKILLTHSDIVVQGIIIFTVTQKNIKATELSEAASNMYFLSDWIGGQK